MANRRRTAAERQADLVVTANCIALGKTEAETTEIVNAAKLRRAIDEEIERRVSDGENFDGARETVESDPPEIARLSRSQVHYDKKDARKLLAESADIDVRLMIAQQMAWLDAIRDEAMSAWAESRQPAHKKVVKKETKPVARGATSLVGVETVIDQWTGGAGDPNLLKVALNAVQEKTDLLRLRERELRDEVAEHPQFEETAPESPEEAAKLLEEKTGSRFAAKGNLKLISFPKKRKAL